MYWLKTGKETKLTTNKAIKILNLSSSDGNIPTNDDFKAALEVILERLGGELLNNNGSYKFFS